MSTYALIIGSAKIFKPFASSRSRKPLKIEVKITFILASERSGTHTMLKCLKSLGVTAFLPPPGGAQAHANRVSLIYLKINFLVS